MNKQEFMKQLEARLKKLPQEEYAEAINYYEQYFEDAANDEEVIAKLGSPDAVASKIFADFATDDTKPKSWKTVWIVILAIFASPIALPIALALVIVTVVLVIAAFVVIVSFAASGVVAILSGIFGAVLSFAFLIYSPASTLFFVGYGLLCAALGIEFIALAKWMAVKSSVVLSRIYGRVLRRSAL